MAENTEISWATHTASFWHGCVKVGPQCDHCYAETLDKRFGESHWGAGGRRRFIKNVWGSLGKWEKKAQATGVRPRVFVMSMGDFFESLPDTHPDSMQMGTTRIDAMACMAEAWKHLDFLVLTKRISNVAKMVPDYWLTGKWPANIRMGISVGTQKDADRDIPRLLALPCPNFLSMEPLLERVSLSKIPDTRPNPLGAGKPWYFQPLSRKSGIAYAEGKGIDWVITGGESGPQARPSHPDWFRSLRDECKAAGVPFHFKQWGEWLSAPLTDPNDNEGVDEQDEMFVRYAKSGCFLWPDGTQSQVGFTFGLFYPSAPQAALMLRVGKKAAGHLLDGVAIQQFPEPAK